MAMQRDQSPQLRSSSNRSDGAGNEAALAPRTCTSRCLPALLAMPRGR